MDLSTKYLGMTLKHPIIASASPLSRTVDGIKRLEDGGAAAIVLFSLFEEQIRFENESFDYLLEVGTDSFPEATTYFPAGADYHVGPDSYLQLIRAARESVEVPIIASLNGVTNEGWIEYAKLMVEAGAQAIELNIYHIPANIEETARQVENRYVNIVRAVRNSVSVPLAVKLSPFFSAMGEMAKRLVEEGANGLVLFNRFYQPDFDLDEMEVLTDLELSSPHEIRLPLLWIAVLCGRIQASLAATTGVQSATEVVKYVLAGADAVMTTSALLRHGPGYTKKIVKELDDWMQRRGYESVGQMHGAMSQEKVANPTAFERANYIKVLQNYRSTFITA
jgi:dihydroorotate dehydrogenase (fumarate)